MKAGRVHHNLWKEAIMLEVEQSLLQLTKEEFRTEFFLRTQKALRKNRLPDYVAVQLSSESSL